MSQNNLFFHSELKSFTDTLLKAKTGWPSLAPILCTVHAGILVCYVSISVLMWTCTNCDYYYILVRFTFLVSTEELLAGVDDTELSKSYCTMIGLHVD